MRRAAVASAAVIALALVAWGILHSLPGSPLNRPAADYRDPVQLAQAVKGKEHSQTASCAKIATGKYICSVYVNGALGTYQVTVSADGKSWQSS